MGVEKLEPDWFALLDFLPDLLVEEVGHRVASGLNEGDHAPNGDAAGQGIADRKGHGKVDCGEAECFGHVIAPMMQVSDAMEP